MAKKVKCPAFSNTLLALASILISELSAIVLIQDIFVFCGHNPFFRAKMRSRWLSLA